jgi:hypothetical protein
VWIDIGLAVAAAIVAIFGTVTKQGPKIKSLLVVLAIIIGLGAIVKSFKDETEKQFVREAITEGLILDPRCSGKSWMKWTGSPALKDIMLFTPPLTAE